MGRFREKLERSQEQHLCTPLLYFSYLRKQEKKDVTERRACLFSLTNQLRREEKRNEVK